MRTITVAALAICTLAGLDAVAQDAQPVANVIAAVKSRVDLQCSQGRQAVASSTRSFDKERAAAAVKMSCECLPAEIELAATDLSEGKENATTTKEKFISRLTVAFRACGARLARADIQARCQAEKEAVLGVEDKMAYCGCVSERLKALDDDSIVTAAATAHQNFQEKVQARIKGQSDPVPVRTVVDDIQQGCKQGAK